MAQLSPYLTFNNNTREAMSYYKECLGGELTLMAVKDTPVCDQLPPEFQDSIMHSSLKTADWEILASDMSPEKLNIGNDVHISFSVGSEKELNTIFAKLSEGGKVKQPINPMFFGLIGTLTDKFGKHWVLTFMNPNSKN
jgi:PhnB protein